MNKRTRGFILTTLSLSLGFWLTAQSPSNPGIQGRVIGTGKLVPVQVDKNGVVIVSASITPSGTQDINLKQVAGTATLSGGIAGSQGVGGLAAAGAAIAGNPVLVGGSDGTNARAFSTDATGRLNVNAAITPGGTQNVQGSAAVGAAAGNPFPQASLDDSGNVLALHSCPDQADIPTTTGTDLRIITATASKTVYICSISLGLSAAQTVTIQQGTQSSTPCDTTTVVMAGGYPNSTAIALDFTPFGPMQTTVAARDVCIHLGGSATFGGFVKYAVY